MERNKQSLIEWLRDAHAMEHAAIDMLENQKKRLENYPEVKQKVSEHLEQSRRQAEMVKECLERHGTDTSTIKEGVAKFMGNAQSLTNAAAGDEVVKNGIADFAFEHFEIASYRSLIGAAEAVDDLETKRVCEEILRQEEEMANWLEENLPKVTQAYLQRELDPQQESKR